MSLSAEDHRAVRALVASMFPFFPSLISLPLLLILYNNIYYGHLILLILILLNASVIIIRPLSSTYPRAVSVAKFASLYIVSILSAVLIVETLFPLVWPREIRRRPGSFEELRKSTNKDFLKRRGSF